MSVAALLVAAGCAAQPPALGSSTATVTVDGQRIGPLQVTCTQAGALWTVRTLEPDPGFTAAFDTDGGVKAQAVQLVNLAGFTGDFWAGTVGEGRGSLANGRFRLSGTAEGYFADDPTHRTETTFEIDTNC